MTVNTKCYKWVRGSDMKFTYASDLQLKVTMSRSRYIHFVILNTMSTLL